MTRARKTAMPARVEPQLCQLVTDPPTGDDWVHEIKLDGYRILARLDRGRVTLLTRNAQDWTAKFPGVARAVATLPARQAWLDGEIVVLDARGTSSFQALQEARFPAGARPRSTTSPSICSMSTAGTCAVSPWSSGRRSSGRSSPAGR